MDTENIRNDLRVIVGAKQKIVPLDWVDIWTNLQYSNFQFFSITKLHQQTAIACMCPFYNYTHTNKLDKHILGLLKGTRYQQKGNKSGFRKMCPRRA